MGNLFTIQHTSVIVLTLVSIFLVTVAPGGFDGQSGEKCLSRTRNGARDIAKKRARAIVREKQWRRATTVQRRGLTPEELERRKLERRRKFIQHIAQVNASFDRHLSEEDREFIELLEEAEAEGDIDFVSDAAKSARESGCDSEVRMVVIDSLATFGWVGLPELADFLQDPDSEVVAHALDRYDLGIQELEDEQEIASLAKLAILTVTDSDQLSLMCSHLTMLNDEQEAVVALADIIGEGGEEAVAAAKEAYESLTGEAWTNEGDADAWLRENYVPDEDHLPDPVVEEREMNQNPSMDSEP